MIEATDIQAPVIQAPVNEAMPSTKRQVIKATIVIILKKHLGGSPNDTFGKGADDDDDT